MWVGVYHLIMRYCLKFSLLQTCKWFFIIDCSDFQDISCTYCIPTLITVFIFFQPLKMNWLISSMLVCLMRETGKIKRVYKLISLVISDFNWNMPHLSAGKLCGVRWYQFTGYVGIISGPETITCKFVVSDVFWRMDLKQYICIFSFTV